MKTLHSRLSAETGKFVYFQKETEIVSINPATKLEGFSPKEDITQLTGNVTTMGVVEGRAYVRQIIDATNDVVKTILIPVAANDNEIVEESITGEKEVGELVEEVEAAVRVLAA